jgi:hypothetical protein
MLRGQQTVEWTKLVAQMILAIAQLLPFDIYKYILELKNHSMATSIVPSAAWIIRSQFLGRMPRTNYYNQMRQLLYMFSDGLECTDDRDKIYGFLGLASDAKHLGIEADYSKTYAEVLLDVSARMMSRQNGMSPLAYWAVPKNDCEDNLCLPSGKNLPSWVARWRSRGLYEYLEIGMRSSGTLGVQVRFSPDKYEMHTSGTIIGTVIQNNGMIEIDINEPQSLDSLNRLEYTITQSRRHVRPLHNQDAIIFLTALARRRSPWEDNESTEAVVAMLKFISLAKDRLKENNYSTILLRSVKQILPEKQWALCKYFLWKNSLKGRAICLVEGNRICLAPGHTRGGDIVTLFLGGPTLYVVRPTADKYLYIGDAFMYGLMNGEALRNLRLGQTELTLI